VIPIISAIICLPILPRDDAMVQEIAKLRRFITLYSFIRTSC